MQIVIYSFLSFVKTSSLSKSSVKSTMEYFAIETYYLMQSSISKRRFVAGEILCVFVPQQQENEWSGLLHCLIPGNITHLLVHVS